MRMLTGIAICITSSPKSARGSRTSLARRPKPARTISRAVVIGKKGDGS
jgi:hypothetical protein